MISVVFPPAGHGRLWKQRNFFLNRSVMIIIKPEALEIWAVVLCIFTSSVLYMVLYILMDRRKEFSIPISKELLNQESELVRRSDSLTHRDSEVLNQPILQNKATTYTDNSMLEEMQFSSTRRVRFFVILVSSLLQRKSFELLDSKRPLMNRSPFTK